MTDSSNALGTRGLRSLPRLSLFHLLAALQSIPPRWGGLERGSHSLCTPSAVEGLPRVPEEQRPLRGERLQCFLTVGAPLSGPLSLVDYSATAVECGGAGAMGESVLERPRAFLVFGEALASLHSKGGSALLWASVLDPFLLPSHSAPSSPGYRRALMSDGHGRFLILLSHALCSLQSGGGVFAALQPLFRYPVPFGGPLDDLCGEAARSCRRVIQVLYQLSHDGLVTVSDASHGSVDWLLWVSRAVREELTRSGDYIAWGNPEREERSLVCGVVHHVLATEVEGTALRTLRDVFIEYLFPSSAGKAVDGSVAERLRQVLQRPGTVFQCAPPSLAMTGLGVGGAASPFTSSVRAPAAAAAASGAPACEGPVAFSQVLPDHVVLLSLEGNEGGSTAASGGGRPTWWVEACSSPPPSRTLPTRRVRVLLLRIDPAGDWLCPEEDSHNTQTFFSYYENDLRERRCERDRWKAGGDEEEAFESMVHQRAGTREVLRPQTEREAPRHKDDGGGGNEDEPEDALILQRLMSSYTATSAGTNEERDAVLLRASLRLLLFSVRHDVDLILTPERAPQVLHSAGERYLAVLRALTNTVKDVGAGSIRVVDGVRLQDFLFLQARHHSQPRVCVGGEESSRRCAPREPLLLCRDSLRVPSSLQSCRRGNAEEEGPILEVLQVVQSPTNVLLQSRLSEVLEADPQRAVERLIPPPFVSMQRLGSRRACLLLVFPRQADTNPSSSMVLVAPTSALAERYAHLLVKCAAAVFNTISDNDGGKGGVVRGGGAAFVSASRALHLLSSRLRRGTATCAVSNDAAVVSEVLDLLSEVSLAVPTTLAESIACSSSSSSLLPPTPLNGKWTRGPRARRKLWGQALQEAVLAPEVAGEPVLHVYTPSAEEVVTRTRSPTTPTVVSASEDREEGSAYKTALAVFAPQQVSVHRDRCPFVESLEDNTRLLRAVVHALSMVFVTAAGPSL